MTTVDDPTDVGYDGDMPAIQDSDVTFTITASIRCGACQHVYTVPVPVDFEDMPTATDVELYAHLESNVCEGCGIPLDLDQMYAHLADASGGGILEAEYYPEARPAPARTLVDVQYPVAVYGTLRSGHGNASWSWEKNGRTSLGLRLLPDHKLVSTGQRAFPYCVPAPGHTAVVELIDVDEQTLAQFDALEGVGSRHYDRCIVTCDDGTEAWVYIAGPWYGKETGSMARQFIDVPLDENGHHDWDAVVKP